MKNILFGLCVVAVSTGCVSFGSGEGCDRSHWIESYMSDEHPKKYKINSWGLIVCDKCYNKTK